MANLSIYANVGTQDTEVLTSGSSWVELDLDNDVFILSRGSDVVADGEAIPSDVQLTQAGIVLTGVEQTVPHYFLADNDANELKEIFNMGNQNKRYVLGFSFDAETASEPTFHAFDDSDCDSVDDPVLGAGTPSSSWVRAICTTDALPGAGWSGTRLAGTSDGYFIWLANEDGPLTGADTLYANLKIVVPATILTSGSSNFILCVKHS